MSAPITYDDSNLQKLFADMEPKRRLQALKGAFRRLAKDVRKVAVSNLRASIRSDRDLENGIRALVLKRKAGFSVTIGSKKMKGRYQGKRNGVRRYNRARSTWTDFAYHMNRQGKEKPVLIWAEAGTKWRRTKSRVRVRGANGKWYTAYYSRGFMRRYGFMDKTAKQVEATTTEKLKDELRTSVEKIAKKYGCK